MKNFKKVMATVLVAATVVTGLMIPQTAEAATLATSETTPIYRMYNPVNGEHLYTTDANEKDVLYSTYGWGFEGVAWHAAKTGTPVYRLYNNVLCNHLYTTDLNEIKVLTSMPDTAWSVDNNGEPLFYSAGDVPIYRVYNEGLQGMHHLTTDENEYNTLPDYGWAQEGVSLYAVATGIPFTTKYAAEGETTAPLCSPYPIYTMLDMGDGWVGFYYPSNHLEDFETKRNLAAELRTYGASVADEVGTYYDTYRLMVTKVHVEE